MEWYKLIALFSALLCLILFLVRGIYLLKLGAPKDLSKPAGKVSDGVIYSYTAAMLPNQKESAYLHLPTYTAGIIYHIGTFVMLLFLLLSLIGIFTPITLPDIVLNIIAIIMTISALCGLGVLIKRIASKNLRYISIVDDYISNIVTTGAQLATVVYVLWGTQYEVLYFIISAIFLLWLPIGKTKHVMYFFFARYHLGFFYGRRGSWPIRNEVK